MGWHGRSGTAGAVAAAAGLGVGGAALAIAKEDPAFLAAMAGRSTPRPRRTHRRFLSSAAGSLRFRRHPES